MTVKPKGDREKVVVNTVRLTSTQTAQDPEHQGTQAKSRWKLLNPLRLQKIPDVPQERIASKEYGASFLSRIFFLWVTPFIKIGYLRELELEDIWKVSPNRTVENLTERLDTALQQHLNSGRNRPLLRAICTTFNKELWIGLLCQVLSNVLGIMGPYLVRHLVSYGMAVVESQRNGTPGPAMGQGMGYAVGIFCMQATQSLSMSCALYAAAMVGGQLRGVMTSKIFTKAMALSARAKAGTVTATEGETPVGHGDGKSRTAKTDADAGASGWDNGRITTLMGVDALRVDHGFAFLFMFLVVPVALVLALVMSVLIIGYSALPGYGLLIVGVGILTFVIKHLVTIRMDINKITDARVSLTQEILQNVRFVKLFGWESSFLARMQASRKTELRYLQKFFKVQMAIIVCMTSTPSYAAMVVFIVYAVTGHDLSPDRIFAALAIFNAVRNPLSSFNFAMTKVTDGWAALIRLEQFFLAEEREELIQWDYGMKEAIEAENASFTWEQAATVDKEFAEESSADSASSLESDYRSDASQSRPFTLNNVNIAVGRGELIAVIGGVGSGKSSFLGALAGDMRLTSGHVRMGVTRAYCPQYAWIQNATVRDNILFGNEYDEARYNAVVDACALRADLAMLTHGDETEVGERGITVSGGQKQRLNIARAIYSNSDLILMDDPLSAVDAHVGRHIMDNAICGLLKDRCRVLATHQLHVLSRCDRIVVMDEGNLHAVGTFEELMRTDSLFQELMLNAPQQEGSDSESDDDKPSQNVPSQSRPDNVSQRPAPALMQQEERASEGWGVWGTYIAASGSFLNLPIALIFLVLAGGMTLMTGVWLSFWTSNRFPSLSLGQYMGIYAALTVFQSVMLYLQSVQVKEAAAAASRRMLQQAMYRVLRAPVSFFDTTPLGRITNRFSQDVQIMDTEIADSLRLFLFAGIQVVGIIIMVIVFYYYFAIAAAILLAVAVTSICVFLPSSRGTKRYEAVLRSVVFARFGESIIGSTCIQAYHKEAHFRERLHEAIDSMNGAYFLTIANQRWLNTLLDSVSNTMILVIVLLVAAARFPVDPSVSGLILSYMLTISQQMTFGVRMFAGLDNELNSVERIAHYANHLEQEAPLHQAPVPANWPEKGRIVFSDVQMRYRPNLPLILKGVTMDVRGGERIGIVGRTGAGKSSIMTALFRLTELSGGHISIDDVDIATVGLYDLRTRLTIIPQDPTLFHGTIRSNLDPFNEHTDLELWSAMRKAHLVAQDSPKDIPSASFSAATSSTSSVPPGQTRNHLHLDTTVDKEGLNFSLGQRQLMALARALVRDSRIIICDEATSSVDFETDARVQETMTTGFGGKTVLCIAHRLRTIIHYDRICVMDQGCIAELDSPVNLWDRGGIFRGMCERSGIRREDIEVSG
ncbi:P-loop containing nucleoside triphosphate hydrolase protein [Aspergillus campestris IBT 28561]|uniref:P-loop containing nucleoside triphosphate hydrolase protein n=1 Tax=Aspergillus campestris (strain IBT 28561) TaxID=1392248 RepID=A0A2I1CRN4_ASPC2|nr:P-loop containing nucleoside triphosphate hydrolase protein [Aspergillus campestris IBT 28561]PKY00275.1 P-loop containing nucleoside triphosphate hydrolase protein [Aspergillus campestris IBT 28561]